jgi:hypothetical protein
MRERECIFIPLKIAKRKRYKNAVDGVVLEAILITEDPIQAPNGRRLRVQHTYSPGTSPPSWSSKGEGEVEGELRQHDGVVVEELVVLRQGFAKHYGGGGVG